MKNTGDELELVRGEKLRTVVLAYDAKDVTHYARTRDTALQPVCGALGQVRRLPPGGRPPRMCLACHALASRFWCHVEVRP